MTFGETGIDFSDGVDDDFVLGLAAREKKNMSAVRSVSRNGESCCKRGGGFTDTRRGGCYVKTTRIEGLASVVDHLKLSGPWLFVGEEREGGRIHMCFITVHNAHTTATLLKDWHEGHRFHWLRSMCPEMWGLGTGNHRIN